MLRIDPSIISAFAALAGATIGGVTSIIASWLAQHIQARAQRFTQSQLRRQELYKVFIGQASKLYIDALQNDKADVFALMELYAEVSRMRVLCSPRVVDSADQIVRKIIDAYLEPNKYFSRVAENDG